MKTLLVVLFMHFVVVNANTYYYQKTIQTDCLTHHASAIGPPRAFSGCSAACDDHPDCGAYQTYQVNLVTTECQLLSLPADFDKSECLSESGWSFYERIHDCPYYVLPDTASAGKKCPAGDNIEDEDVCQAFYASKQAELPDKTAEWVAVASSPLSSYGCSIYETSTSFTVFYDRDSTQQVGTSSLAYSVCKDTECSATSGGNCYLYYRQAEFLTAATDGSGNQYCVMPGEEGSILKCSDHYGFGTRHCDCEASTSDALKNLICGRCDTEMENTCRKHVDYCHEQYCTSSIADTNYQIAAQQWSLTECLYTKYTCIKDTTLEGYTLDVDHRRICPGYKTKQWDSSQTAHIDDPDDADTCEEDTKDPDNSLTQSAWWAVPRPYKVIEGRSCSNGAGSGKITGGTYHAQQFGSDYYAALPGCARACDMDSTCDGFRLGTKDNNMPGQCMLFEATSTSDADNFETLVTTHCTVSNKQDMYIKTETSPSPPPPPAAVSPPPPSPPPTTTCAALNEQCDGLSGRPNCCSEGTCTFVLGGPNAGQSRCK